MRTKLIAIGNSMGVRLPKALIEQFALADGEIDLQAEERGILISSVKKPRDGWREKFADAQHKGEAPEQEILEAIQNDFDKTEWTW